MSIVFVVWTWSAALFSLVALFRVWRKHLSPPRPSLRRPNVLLLRPVDAPSETEVKNFEADIVYEGQIRHVVVSPFRPPFKSGAVEWLPSDPLTENRKVGHLLYALAVVGVDKDTVVLSVDADVRVDGALVNDLVQGLSGGAALVSAAPEPSRLRTIPGRAVRGLLMQSHHSFRVLDVMSAGAKAVCGKALALSAPACAELARLHDCLGEDLELSQQLQNKGLAVEMCRAAAHVPLDDGLSWTAARERFTRWMQVLRAHRPVLFPTVPLLFAPTPMLMVLSTVFADWALAGSLFVLVSARILLASALDRRPGWRFEWLLGEALLLSCWVRALVAGPRVSWRGREFRVSHDGKLTSMVALPNRGESC
jgi:ceramide glucosyltransferase